MTDVTLAPNSVPAIRIQRADWLGAVAHRAEVLRRRGRRNRYLALNDRFPRPYPWLETMFQGMAGR